MPSAAFPTVLTTLASVIDTALPTTRVVSGRDITNDASDVVMVGVADIEEGSGWDSAGTFEQAMQAFGGSREERGQVNCLILAQRGDEDPTAAITAATDALTTISATIKAAPALGVPTTTLEYLVAELESGAVQVSLNTGGSAVILPFAVFYKARI